jgi:hypothetical protein
MAQQQPLDLNQQEIINAVAVTHRTLALARKTVTAEFQRRIAAEKLRLAADYQRSLEGMEARLREDMDREMLQHELAEDEALVAAYESGIPVIRIAQDGFGNRTEGGVQTHLMRLRADGRIGTRGGYQGKLPETVVDFPKPVDVGAVLNHALTIQPPRFKRMAEPLVLVEASAQSDAITVEAVVITMDGRDPYFKSIADRARPGTQYKTATTATLYLHPATGELIAKESREMGETMWDHPVARWVKEHKAEAHTRFLSALK